MEVKSFETVRRVVFGYGSIEKLADEVKRVKGTKVLVVTDPGIKAAGLVELVTGVLARANLAHKVFAEVEPDPRVEVALASFEAAKAYGPDVIVGLGGGAAVLLGWLFYSQRQHTPTPGEVDPLGATWLGPLYHAFERKWWVDEIYNKFILTPYTELSGFLAETIDQGLIDGVVNGVGRLAAGIARLWGTLQNGFVRRYALSFVAGVVIIMAYLLLR